MAESISAEEVKRTAAASTTTGLEVAAFMAPCCLEDRGVAVPGPGDVGSAHPRAQRTTPRRAGARRGRPASAARVPRGGDRRVEVEVRLEQPKGDPPQAR